MTSQSHHTQQQIEFPPYELEITLDRSSGIYKEQEWISGFVKVIHPDEEQFNPIYSKSLKIQGEGFLTAQNRQTNKQLESITSQNYSEELFKVQTVAAEDQQVTYKDTFAFKFKLQPNKNQKLLETYVGVYISVSYEINCTMKLQSGQKIQGVLPFYVQCPGQGKENIKGELVIPRPQQIEMSPEKLLIQNPNQRIPDFKIIGKLESDIDYFQNDIKGSFIIEECDGTVRTIDLQLIRVEKIENEKGKFQEATEIQLIQVADGNVSRHLEIPLYMIYPTYFSCPNFTHGQYQVDFEVNFIMILYDGFKITMNFPLNIIRD